MLWPMFEVPLTAAVDQRATESQGNELVETRRRVRY